jgi:hypothetical protein
MSKIKLPSSTEERFKLAKEGHDSGKYSSIEAAAKATKISPATYYNYARKLTTPEKKASDDEYSQEEINRVIRENQSLRTTASEVTFLRDQVEKLKNKLIDMILVKG